MRFRLGEQGACAVVPTVVASHIQNLDVVLIGCTTIANLARTTISQGSVLTTAQEPGGSTNSLLMKAFAVGGNKQVISNNHLLFNAQTPELVVQLLQSNLDSQEVSFFVCVAIDSLADLQQTRIKLSELGLCEILITRLKMYRTGEGFVMAALTALGTYTGTSACRSSLFLYRVFLRVVWCLKNDV
jgi:hypothetical protein